MKKKVTAIILNTDPHGEPYTYTIPQSGKVLYNSIITFEDGSSGRFNHETTTQSHFVVGQESEFEAENKGTWWKLSKPKPQYSGGGGGSKWIPKTNSEYKRDAVREGMRIVKDMIVEGTIPLKDFGTTLTQIMNDVHKEIDRIEG